MTLVLQEIPLEQIRPSPHNPRIFRDRDAELASLADSIRSVGVLHPVLVRPVHAVNGDGAAYELIAGERRWRAAKLAGVAAIPATVRDDLDEQQALELTVTENLQREDLHPLEESKGVASLLGEGHDYRAVADRLGKSVGWVARRSRLTKLSKTWLKLAIDPKSPIARWPATHLELVARLEPKAQDAFFQQSQWLNIDRGGDLFSASELQRRLADWTRELRLAPWKTDDATLDPQAGACGECPKRSSCTPGLFDDDAEAESKAGDRCLDATCWDRKLDRHLERKLLELEAKHGKVLLGGYLPRGEKMPAFVGKRQSALVNSWEGRRAKRGDKGAVPLLIVAGEDRGKLEWRIYSSATASSAAKKAAGGGEKPKPATLTERRKKLEARRQAHALEAICSAVESSTPPSVDEVITIAAAFGTSFNAMQPGRIYSDGKHVDPKGLLAKPSALGRLWCAVAEVLAKRWKKTHAWDGLKGIEQCRPEIEEIARRIGLDLEPYAAKAAEAIPEPKIWAHLKADGTPKKAPETKKASSPNSGSSAKRQSIAAAAKKRAVTPSSTPPDPEHVELDRDLRERGQCPACGGPLKKNAAYCGKCGIDPNAHPTTHHREDGA